MIFFGHLGITAAGFRVYEMVSARRSHGKVAANTDAPVCPADADCPHIDYRLVLVGSVLPDLLDKPLWFLGYSVGSISTRAYGHSFLFGFTLLLVGLLLLNYRRPWLLTLALASLPHLVMDQMWLQPRILWWPLLGPVPVGPPPFSVLALIRELLTHPHLLLSEMLGIVLLVFVGRKLRTRRDIVAFLKHGTLRL